MLSAVRKNGRMVSPDTVASSFTNAEKSIAVMLRPSPTPPLDVAKSGMPGNRRPALSRRRHHARSHCPPVLGRASAALRSKCFPQGAPAPMSLLPTAWRLAGKFYLIDHFGLFGFARSLVGRKGPTQPSHPA